MGDWTRLEVIGSDSRPISVIGRDLGLGLRSTGLTDITWGFREVCSSLYECILDFFNESFSEVFLGKRGSFLGEASVHLVEYWGDEEFVCLIKYGVTLWSSGFSAIFG